MYTIYQVTLISESECEDRILSEWNSEDVANEIAAIEKNCRNEGQEIIVKPVTRNL